MLKAAIFRINNEGKSDLDMLFSGWTGSEGEDEKVKQAEPVVQPDCWDRIVAAWKMYHTGK